MPNCAMLLSDSAIASPDPDTYKQFIPLHKAQPLYSPIILWYIFL